MFKKLGDLRHWWKWDVVWPIKYWWNHRFYWKIFFWVGFGRFCRFYWPPTSDDIMAKMNMEYFKQRKAR